MALSEPAQRFGLWAGPNLR